MSKVIQPVEAKIRANTSKSRLSMGTDDDDDESRKYEDVMKTLTNNRLRERAVSQAVELEQGLHKFRCRGS